MVELSTFRLIGLLAGLGLMLAGALALRRARPNAAFIAMFITGGLGISIVSLFPGLVTILNDVLSIGSYPGSRLIALIMLALFIMWIVLAYQQARLAADKQQIDKLIRHSAVKEFSQTAGVAARIPRDSVLCILPALDEEKNIASVLRLFPETLFGLPVVPLIVDDGSKDKTKEVAEACGAVVLQSPFQRGGGAAIRLGFDVAEKFGAKIAVTLDADGQNDPQEMKGLVEPIVNDAADVVIGSRMLGSHEITYWWRHVGVQLFSFVFNTLMGTRITDISSGYRAIRVDKISKLRLLQDQYHTSEFLVMCAKQGLRIAEAPIHFRRRASGKSKKGNELLYGFRFARALFSAWLRVR